MLTPIEKDLDRRLTRIEQRLARLQSRLDQLEGLPEDTAPAPVISAPAVPEPSVENPTEPCPIPARPPEPPPQPDRPKPPPGPTLADRLRLLGLLPPPGSLEVQLGAWWVTRIGMLLGVLGVVWFGSYITQGTPPWVRWLELLFVSLAVAGAGLWIERRMERFGAVVFAGGLAMIYFAAYAAQVIPAVRIFESAGAGLALQLAAVGLLAGSALWRRSEPIMMMGILFGLLACLFSVRTGLAGAGLATALVLAGAAVGLQFLRRWQSPLVVAVVGLWLIYAATAAFQWHWRGEPVSYGLAIGYVALALALLIGSDLAAHARGCAGSERLRFITHTLSASLAVALALMVTMLLDRTRLETTFFGLGALLLIASSAYYLPGAHFNLMHAFFIKGLALLTLGWVTHYEGEARWIALAIQAGVLLGSAWRTRLKVTEAAVVVVWLLSLALMVRDLAPVVLSAPAAGHGSGIALLYVGISTVALGLYGRLFGRPDREGRQNAIVLALGLGLAATLAGALLGGADARPLALAILAGALALAGLPLGHWLPALAGLVVLAAAHVAVWFQPATALPGISWVNGLAVTAVTLTAAVGLGRVWPNRRWPRHVAHAAWMLTLLVVPWTHNGAAAFLPMAVGLGFVAAGLALLPTLGLSPVLIGLPLFYGLTGFGLRVIMHPDPRLVHLDEPYFLVALVGAFGLVAFEELWPPLRERFRRLPSWVAPIHMTGAVLIGQVAMAGVWEDERLMLAHALAAVAVAVLAWRPGLRWAPAGAVYYLVFANLIACVGLLAGFPISLLLTVALATLLAGSALRRMPGRAEPGLAWWLGGAAALALTDLLILDRAPGQMVTILWGLAGGTVLALGFIERARPLRLVGLAGLALCLPRVFLVDIHSTLHRIAASLVLGMVLLAVGFVYHRFQKMIERPEQIGLSSPPDQSA